MIFDTHVHIGNFETPDPSRVLREMDKAGIDKTAMFAEEPAYLEGDQKKIEAHNAARLDRLIRWCEGSESRLLPVYFIQPIEKDALAQVDRALDAGAIGFKIICENFDPSDERAMPVYEKIAAKGKSILFHSGILWDMGDNSRYCRPANFECMLNVPKAKFALAHIGWPWCDETIAVYGKFMAMKWHPAYRGQEMYIDMTPGTPDCYRAEVIKRLFDVGYDELENRLLFGSDNFTGEYEGKYAADIRDKDRKIFASLHIERIAENVFGQNALRFWGIKG